MNRPLQLGLMSLCFLTATAVGGWWGLVVVGGVAGYMMRAHSRVGWTAAGAAAAAWALLLAWDASQGPVGELARLVGGSLAMPGVALLGVTLVFAAVVGGLSASAVAAVSDPSRAVTPASAMSAPERGPPGHKPGPGSP